MGHYRIETTHTPEQCLADLDTVLEQSPGLLQKLEWGCRTGVHMGWAVVEAPNASDTSRQVPPGMRSRTRVVGIQRFTPDEIRALHVK
ncbi:MAG: hypothetical protein QN172_08620 [Armatimonadota bacterium]|nr:hypothetical protein [Armatimonadota bacterium]